MRVETRSGVFDAVTETVSPTYFDMVGARLSAGRFFSDSDDAVVVISEGFRRRLFGNGPGVGETIKVDARAGDGDRRRGGRFRGSSIRRAFRHHRAIRADASGRRRPGRPYGPFRSRDVVGRLARGVSIDAARAELLARWPSIQSATLPSTLPEPEREALLRQRLDVAPLATGFSGSPRPVRHHARGAPGPDGDAPGGRVRQPCGPHPGALADPAAPGRDSSRAGWKRAARVLAAAARRDPAVGRGVRWCGAAGVGDRPSS